MYTKVWVRVQKIHIIHFAAGVQGYYGVVAAVAAAAAAAAAEILQPGEAAGSLPAAGEAVWPVWQQQPVHAAWECAPSSRDGTHGLCVQHGRGSVDSGRVFPEHA